MSDVRCQKQNGFGGVEAAVFGLAFMLGLFGLLTIISSQSGERGPTMLALLQLRNFLIGLAVLAVAARLDFSFYRRYAAVLAGPLSAGAGWWCWRRWPGWFRWGCSRIWERPPFTRRWRSQFFFSVEFRCGWWAEYWSRRRSPPPDLC